VPDILKLHADAEFEGLHPVAREVDLMWPPVDAQDNYRDIIGDHVVAEESE